MNNTVSTFYKIADRYNIMPQKSDNVYIILTFILYKNLSKGICEDINNWMNNNGHSNIDYMTISDKEAESFKVDIINTTGYFIYPSQLFDNYILTYHKDILVEIADVFDTVHCPETYRTTVCNIARELKKFSQDPIMTVSWNEQAFRNSKAFELLKYLTDQSNIIPFDEFDTLFDNLTSQRSYMLSSWAEGYTPSLPAKLIVELVTSGNTDYKNIYNPYCEYGSLMIQFRNILIKRFYKDPVFFEEYFNKLRFWGTNNNQAVLSQCWMNLILNHFHLNQFILKVSNPLEDNSLTDSDKFDIIISSYTKDFSIVEHILKHLGKESVAAILTFPGVLFRSGRDKEIRERLIEKNQISAIIQLPRNTFSRSGIAPCIMLLSNKHKDKKGIYFINASKDPKSDFNYHVADVYFQGIIDAYSNQDNIPHFSRFVSQEEIIENEGNLNVSKYIQPYSPIENHGYQNGINDWSRTYKFNNSTLTIRFGDVVTSKAEVIVSSDDTEISMGGGVSKSILEAGGEFVKEDAQKKLPALLGDVIVSTAGKLTKQKYIFHCLTIDYNHNMEFYKSTLSGKTTMNEYIVRHCIEECFRLMQALNLKSIAFPLIGTGVAGIDMNMVARCMSETITEHLSHTNIPYQIELYLMDRFGKKEKIDYQRVIESFSFQEMLMERDNINKYESEDDSSAETFVPSTYKDYPVFISFSDKDWSIVNKLILQVLKKVGIECFAYKKENYAGSNYQDEIIHVLKHAKVIIFAWTNNSIKSSEVRKELDFSLSRNKLIIPIRLDDSSNDWFDYNFLRIDYIDPNRMPNATQKLIEKVEFEIKRGSSLQE